MSTTIASLRGGVTEKYAPGDNTPWTVGAAQATTGGRFVEAMTGSMVCRTGQAASLLGVGLAIHDAAAGETVTVAHEGVWMVRANGAITAGNRLQIAANGEAAVLAAVDAAGSFDPRAIAAFAFATISNGADGPAKLAY